MGNDSQLSRIDHNALVANMTGGMISEVPKFSGSKHLHPDGRPRADFRDSLRKISNTKNIFSIALALLAPLIIIRGAVITSHLIGWVTAFFLIAIAQNRLFILHHEAAHRTLFTNRKINDFLGIHLIGLITFGTGSHGYRINHLAHHRDEFGPNEPDFLLYSLYPISKASMRRKLTRDVLGISALRILRPRFKKLNEIKKLKLTAAFLLGQTLIFLTFAITSRPWLYLFLWAAPWAFVYQVLNRLRAIAEHGGMTQSTDRRYTTHHVRQTLLARLAITPYKVGYHLAHHIDMSIPWRNLPKLHKVLIEDGYLTNETVWPNYRTLWRALRSGDEPQLISEK
tara:strand:+ start:890 stop:1909 length:1020 start_codon:yes stop_codon:yes gene_type:complete